MSVAPLNFVLFFDGLFINEMVVFQAIHGERTVIYEAGFVAAPYDGVYLFVSMCGSEKNHGYSTLQNVCFQNVEYPWFF